MATQVNFNEATNAQVLNDIRNRAGYDYQQRVPVATQANIKNVLDTIQSYRPHQNEFWNGLINRIGTAYAHKLNFENPLAVFKRNSLNFGDTIQEMKTGLLEATGYSAKRDSLEKEVFGASVPYVESNYHTINREDKYKFTLNKQIARRAFIGDEMLSQIVSEIMSAPVTSDNWDEFNIMSRLLLEYERKGGFFHVRTPDVANPYSDGADARSLLRTIRAWTGNLRFIDTAFNAAHLPVAVTNPEDLLLITTPSVKAALDVEALAAAFNIDRQNVAQKIVELPDQMFNFSGAQAILTSKDFFVCADTLYETTSIFNPAGLIENYWLHHHGIYSASRYVPAVMFSSIYNDEVITVNNPVEEISAITIYNADGEVVQPDSLECGRRYQFSGYGITNPPSDNNADNEAVTWTLTGANFPETQIDQNGYLEIAQWETSTSLTVSAQTVFIDPSNAQSQQVSRSVTVTIVGGPLITWPVEHDHSGEPVEVTPTAPTFEQATNTITIPDVAGVEYQIDGVEVPAGPRVITEDTTVTAVPLAGFTFPDDAETEWSFTFVE